MEWGGDVRPTRCRGMRSSPPTRSGCWTAAGGGSSPRSGSSSPSRRRWSCSARPGSRWTATWSGSTPSSCWSRWPRRRASSTCRPATRRTACTSAATTWCSAGSTGCPFVREGDVRRDATLDDFRRLSMLAQSFPELDSAGGVICEPNDAPLDSRHLDMIYALQTVTDKIYMGNVVSGPNAVDTIAMTVDPVRRPGEKIEQTPATISLINCNSPLRWDDRMLDAQFEYCAAEPAGRPHPVPADGRHVAGDHPGGADAAARRGAVRHRAGPAHPAGLPGHLRLVPVQHRHAVRVASLGTRSRRSGCCAPASWPGTTGCRSGPAAA